VPELPDVTVYCEALRPRVVEGGRRLQRLRIISPFILRSTDPSPETLESRRVVAVSRIGKRIVLEFENDLFLVLHLMIAGRLRWFDAPARASKPPRIVLATLDFDSGILWITEAGTTKRASLHIVQGRDALASFARGGLDVLTCSPAAFASALRSENRTLKRALSDPRLFDGIGNAYSDEILHAARLSPLALTSRLTDEESSRLHAAARDTLSHWIDRLRRDFGLDHPPGRFPGSGEITAFRPGFAVHGRFGLPCPVCNAPVQRIVYSENETNYCARCQTGGKVLADRSLSRLLKDDWPRTIEEWE